MTSKKAMFGSGRWRLPALAVAVLVGVGCEGSPARIIEPTALTSPYPAPKLWAVAPFRNESGFSLVDGAAFADHLTRRLQQVQGIRVVPVNRVLAALAAERLEAVNSREAALRVMQTLDADGLVVGTLTAWDPYLPPKLGVICQLHSRHRYDGSQLGRGAFDPLTLRTAGVDDQKLVTGSGQLLAHPGPRGHDAVDLGMPGLGDQGDSHGLS